MKKYLYWLLLVLFGYGQAVAQTFMQFTTELPSVKVNALLNDTQGRLWVGTDAGLVVRNAAGEWKKVSQEAAQWLTTISAIQQDEQGHFWIGVSKPEVRLVHLDEQGNYIRHFDVPNFQNKNQYINGIAIDRVGRKWLATENGGVWMIDTNGKWFCYDTSTEEYMPSNKIRAIVVDEEDIKWVGTDQGLISTMDGKQWTLYDVIDDVNALTADGKGNVCVSVVERNKKQRLYCNNEVFKIMGKQQRDNLFRIKSLLIDPEDKIVWAAGTGLARYAKSEKMLFDWDNSAFSSNAATCMALGSGENGRVLWIGTADQGLFQLSFPPQAVAAAQPEPEPIVPKPEPEPQKVETAPVVSAKLQEVAVQPTIKAPEMKKAEEVKIVAELPKDEDEVKPAKTAEPVEEKTVVLQNQTIKKGDLVKLQNINFAKGSFKLTDYRGADLVLNFLRDNPGVNIALIGHSDKNPDPSHPEYEKIKKAHYELSLNRVQMVADYLIGMGIAPERITLEAYGGERPLVNKSSPDNMRVELKILSIK
ncbi:two-component regulator propeller domain-containing protein [Rhodoflexus caldus]|uniref:two-component regulator propeller domain-containing protein n=1 Tax=Rhodoflexus caldus TaxID=2891236 RepID=UPI002029F5C1|nr:two-component regulator propeller domain-containing protein [Rhodoflexus caldus]